MVRLRDRSVRELIAELARLEDAARFKAASPFPRDPDPDRLRGAERRVIAELRRRHVAPRRVEVTAPVTRVWQVGAGDGGGMW